MAARVFVSSYSSLIAREAYKVIYANRKYQSKWMAEADIVQELVLEWQGSMNSPAISDCKKVRSECDIR